MLCRECGASRVPFRSFRLFIRRVAARFGLGRILRGGKPAGPAVAYPSVTELVALVERDAGITIFG